MARETTAPQNAHRSRLQVRWSDQDLNHHVNNARTLTLIEEARVRAGRAWSGTTPDGGDEDSRVVRNLSVEFNRPINYQDDVDGDTMVDAQVWITRIGNTSYTVCHELLQDGAVCAYAEAVIVMLAKIERTPTPITSEIGAGLARFQDPSFSN